VSYDSEGKYELTATDESEAEPGRATHGFWVVEIPMWEMFEQTIFDATEFFYR